MKKILITLLVVTLLTSCVTYYYPYGNVNGIYYYHDYYPHYYHNGRYYHR